MSINKVFIFFQIKEIKPVNIPVFKRKQLAVAILASVPLFGAQATIIDLNLSATTSAQIDINSAVTDADGPTPASVNSSATDNTGPSSYANANANGNLDGSFNSSTSGFGTYNSSATFLQSYSVENDPFDQVFDFTFTIENGSLDVGCHDGYGEGDFNLALFDEEGPSNCMGTANASYDAEIRLDGVSIWNSMAELAFDGTNTSITTSGEMLGMYTPASTYYSWSPQSFTLDLGSFAGGDTFTLDYEITLSTSGTNGNSYAQFGDPNGFGQSGSPFTATTSVPEPASLGIIAAGLGLLGFNRRRKSKINH